MSNSFSKKDSLAVKGFAILMMLWHHCLSLGIENAAINPWPLKESQIMHIAVFCKICVSLFAFISGYGLWLSYLRAKKAKEQPFKWIILRLVHTLSGYWFVVILSWIICGFFNGWTYFAYDFDKSIMMGLWNMLIDFWGLANFFGGKLLNPIWWYMSAAIIFVVILPLFDKLMEFFGGVCSIAVIWIITGIRGGYPGGENYLSFLTIFCIGAVFASKDIFKYWIKFWGNRKGCIEYLVLIAAMGIIYKLYHALDINLWWNVKFSIVPLIPLLLIWRISYLYPFLGYILGFLGKHATNIFLVHAFLYAYYGCAFIYGAQHWALILLRLLWSSLGLSFFIEAVKYVTRYNLLIKKLESII